MNKPALTSPLFKLWTKTYAFVMLCYSPFFIYFLWGNHDWGWIKENTPVWSGVFEGRFSQFFIPNLLFSGLILPVLSNAFGLAAFTFATILFLKLWNFPKKNFLAILLTVITVTSSYTLSWFYFAFLTLSCLSWPLIIASAFYLLQKNKNTLLSATAATALFTLALGGYPPIINMMGTILFMLLLADLCLYHFTLSELLRKYTPHIISILAAVSIFCFIQYLLKKTGLQQETYNTAGIDLSTLPKQLKIGLTESLTQFTYTTSFITAPYKYLTLFLFMATLSYLFCSLKKNTLNILFFLLFLLALLLSSVFTTIIAQNTNYVWQEPRIKFFTLPYITLFSAAMLLQSKNKTFTNIVYATLLLLISNNLITNCYAAKIWLLGFKAEADYSERFISRLEEQKNFNPTDKQYTFIQSGTISFRPKYAVHTNNDRTDSYTLTAPYIPWHLPYKAYTFYYPYTFINQDFDVYWKTVHPAYINMTDKLADYLTQDSQPWPHRNAVYFSEDLIILTQSADGKKSGENWFYNYFTGYPH